MISKSSETEPKFIDDEVGIADIVTQLATLVAHGWSEQQIIGLARMRGSYKYENINLGAYAQMHYNLEQMKRWLFVRWLYRSGRIVS